MTFSLCFRFLALSRCNIWYDGWIETKSNSAVELNFIISSDCGSLSLSLSLEHYVILGEGEGVSSSSQGLPSTVIVIVRAFDMISQWYQISDMCLNCFSTRAMCCDLCSLRRDGVCLPTVAYLSYEALFFRDFGCMQLSVKRSSSVINTVSMWVDQSV